MKALAVTSVLSLYVILASAQIPSTSQKTPQDVVQEFWAMETQGGTLTEDGWYGSSPFFIRLVPGPPSSHRVLHVIDRTDKIEETARAKNWAEVTVYTNDLGQIDPGLRFKRQLPHGPRGLLILRGPWITFNLVLTDKQWKLNSDGGREQAVTAPEQWLIDCAEATTPWINIDTAVRYVRQMREKTTDPAIRKNADATIAALQKLR